MTRLQSETIHVGDGITIMVVGIRGGAVRLGITAPDDMLILRGELKELGDRRKAAEGGER